MAAWAVDGKCKKVKEALLGLIITSSSQGYIFQQHAIACSCGEEFLGSNPDTCVIFS
jgi:hypothetical protein